MPIDHFFIAIIAALVNLFLSILVPCALKKTNASFLTESKKFFNQNREMLYTSSSLVAVIVYLALEAAPIVKDEMPQLYRLFDLGNPVLGEIPQKPTI
jgi:hypothetical protein